MTLRRLLFSLLCGAMLLLSQEVTDLRGPANGWLDQTPVWTAAGDGERLAAEGRIRQITGVIEETLPIFHSDGEASTILLRFHNPGAAALRVHFNEFHLTEGSRAFVYGLGADGQVTRIAGPYTGAGPLGAGEFWARSVPGETVIVELQLAEEVATLPVTVSEIAVLDTIEDWTDSIVKPDAEIRTSLFRGMKVTHAVVDGEAILEGDMLLGRAEELEPYVEGKSRLDRESVFINGSYYRWPGGIVPYAIDPTLPNQTRITDAVAHWNTQLAGYIKLIPRTTETNYVVYRPAAATTCSSYVGRVGGAQPINTGDYCSTGNMIHETGHAIGMFHEHTRTDRNTYVQVLTQNINPSASYNFQIMTNSVNPSPYDYNSIMHYPAYAFSINGQPTIVTIPAGIPIGQRSGLSAGDVAGAKSIYPAATGGGGGTGGGTTGTVTVTFATVPAGRVVVVDNVQLTTPATRSWTAGSSHVVVAPSQIWNSNSKYMYTSWSDGGAQQHTVTTPAAATTYTANFSVQYLLTAKANNTAAGSVSKSPASVDSYYASGSTVNIMANPAGNYCLAGWTGILPVTSTMAAVTMSQPQTATANFQIGSVTVPASTTVKNSVTTVSVSVTATTGCIWKATSLTNWITVQNATGQSSGVLTLKLTANPSTALARSGYVQVNNKTVRITQSGN
ncbi:MAG: hypothetical protein HY820_30525 [Acidobacteria bacterium]|nr:hypothetical protein [Acidobacteriota bacterium]